MIQTSSLYCFETRAKCTFDPCFERSPNGKNIGEFTKFSICYGHIKYFIAAEFKRINLPL